MNALFVLNVPWVYIVIEAKIWVKIVKNSVNFKKLKETNGMVERFNGTLVSTIKFHIKETQLSEWNYIGNLSNNLYEAQIVRRKLQINVSKSIKRKDTKMSLNLYSLYSIVILEILSWCYISSPKLTWKAGNYCLNTMDHFLSYKSRMILYRV